MADAAPPRQRDLASVGEAWGFGQFPAAVDRSKGGLLDASGDEEAPADENVRLRGELQQLQLALQHTQSALVDRYRGGSHKTVGGAQFRMGDMGSRGVKAPIPPPQKCAECASVKLVLKKTRTEKDALAESLGVAESDLAISRDGHAATCREAAAATAEHREKLRDDLDELALPRDAPPPLAVSMRSVRPSRMVRQLEEAPGDGALWPRRKVSRAAEAALRQRWRSGVFAVSTARRATRRRGGRIRGRWVTFAVEVRGLECHAGRGEPWPRVARRHRRGDVAGGRRQRRRLVA